MARIKNMGHATVRFNEGVIISGSEGNIQISSSTFHLSPEGHITASNFDLQTGTIRADVTIEGDLSANSIAVQPL